MHKGTPKTELRFESKEFLKRIVECHICGNKIEEDVTELL